MCFSGSTSASTDASNKAAQDSEVAANQSRQQETNREAAIDNGQQTIDKSFAGYNDDYYNGIKTNYINSQMPALDDQYQIAKDQLAYSLARGGNTNSSTAGYQSGQLAKNEAQQEEAISDNASDAANAQQQKITAAKTGLIGQVASAADSTGANAAASQAAGNAASAGVTASVSPLADVFGGLTAAYGNVKNLQTQQALAGYYYPQASGAPAQAQTLVQ